MKYYIAFVLFLPLVFFRPLFSLAALQSYFNSNATIQANQMYENGVRKPINSAELPIIIVRHVIQTSQDNECYIQKVAKIYLYTPQKFVGYEVVLACPDSPAPFVGLYYNSAEEYLDTIAIGYN